MSFSSELTYKSILESAKKEFLLHGFYGASMRKIAKGAHVTTGAMYNYFKNKEIIFDVLVREVADELLKLFIKQHEHCDMLKSYNEENAYETMSQSADCVLDYMYENFEIMKLIICYSQGTVYEDYIEKLITVEEKSTRKMLLKSNYVIGEQDDFFIHIIASSGMINMFEAIKHNLSKENAVYYMNKINEFYFAGWKELL